MDARQIVLAPDRIAVETPTSAAVSALRVGFRALSAIAPGVAARAAERLWLTPPRPKIRDEARAFLSTGSKRMLDVNGRSVATWAWGHGPRVILVHGWGGYGAQMQGFVEPLARQGFEVVLFDAPAHGVSGPSQLGTRRSTLFEFSDALSSIAGEAPSLAGVIAHSGGCTAAAWALRYATWNPAAMVFVSPMASPIRYRGIFQEALGLSDGAMRRFTANTERRFGFRWEDFEVPAMADRFRTPPVLVVHDRDDRETSWSEGEAIAKAWPGARLHSTTGLGHRRILRDPTVIGEVTRFLQGRV